MDILSYLATLIQSNNEVGVPGLGTFLKRKSPGRYDAGLHAFLPPSYQLAFHPEVTETGLLVEYVGKQHNLSEASARYHIEQFVTKVKQQLDEELEADVMPLGRLLLSGRLVTFLPNDELNLGHQFFGLPTVAEEQPAEPEEVITEAAAENVEVADIEVPETEVPETELAETEQEADKLEAIIMENSIEEENPGQLPEEPIYIAEPLELTEDTPAEEVVETEVAPVEETPVVEETIVPEPALVEKPPVVETPRVETPEVVPPFYRAGRNPAEEVNYLIEEQPKPSTPQYYKVLIIVLFLLCLAFGLYMLKPEWFRKNNRVITEPEQTTAPLQEKPTVVLPDTLETATDTFKRDGMIVDSSQVKVSPATTTPAATQAAATQAPATTPAVKTPVKPTVISYEVIASSVYGEKAAQQFIASMKKKWGINAKIVSQLPGKKIKISVASFKDEKTARAERGRLEEKLKIPGLYIYTNTNKPE